LASTRGEGVTIIGAITSKSNKLIYYLCDGSTIPNLKIFFHGLNNTICLKDKVLVLDNLQAHRNLIFRKWLEYNYGAKIFFLPVATSFFNPIETIWAWVKAQWRKRLLDPILEDPDLEFLI
jgi:transposase